MITSRLRYPLNSIYFYSTDKCNLFCRHCWISPKHIQKGRKDGEDIEIRWFVKAIKEAKPLGLQWIKITGGEPFLRDDIIDLIKIIKEEKLDIIIETNGTLFSETLLKAIKNKNIKLISVSLDGAISKTHDEFRSVNGCFSDAVRGIRLLRKYEFPVQVIMALYKGNVDEIEDTIKLAQKLGAGSFKINIVEPFGRGKNIIEERGSLSIREILNVQKLIDNKLTQKYNLKIYLSIPPAFHRLSYIKSRDYQMCRILNIIGILHNGNISICGIGKEEPDLVMGNIKKDNLASIWFNNSILGKIRDNVPKNLGGICGRCILRNICLGQCLAGSYAENKDFSTDHRFCRTAYKEGLFPAGRLYK